MCEVTNWISRLIFEGLAPVRSRADRQTFTVLPEDSPREKEGLQLITKKRACLIPRCFSRK